MKTSRADLGSHDVFNYDFTNGKNGLKAHLAQLQKDASENGDVTFIFPDGSTQQTYTALFYIAAGKKPPGFFGRADGASVHILEDGGETHGIVNEAIGKCCTKETLEELWKTVNMKHFEVSGPHALFQGPVPRPGLPDCVMPDFTIHLKNPGGGKPLLSAKVHRFLLPIRIAYFKTQFGSSFRDAHATEASFYTEEFTDCAIWAVVAYAYDVEPWTMFEPYSLSSHLSVAPVAPEKYPNCTAYRPGDNTPPPDTIDRLMEIVRAADFLQIPDLKGWAHYSIVRMAHEFTCSGVSCEKIVPRVLDLVSHSEITDGWIMVKGLKLLMTPKGIKNLWKRPLVKCNEDFLNSLVTKACTTVSDPNTFVEYYLRFHQLASRVATSNQDWHDKILDPIFKHASLFAAGRLGNSKITDDIATVLKSINFAKPGAHDLLRSIVSPQTMSYQNCESVFHGIRKLEKLIAPTRSDILREANHTVIDWFRKNWPSLSLMSGEPPLGGNFFNAWPERDIEALSTELEVPVADLFMLEARKGKGGNSYAYDPVFKSVKSKFRKDRAGKGSTGKEEVEVDEWGNEGLSQTGADKGSPKVPSLISSEGMEWA